MTCTRSLNSCWLLSPGRWRAHGGARECLKANMGTTLRTYPTHPPNNQKPVCTHVHTCTHTHIHFTEQMKRESPRHLRWERAQRSSHRNERTNRDLGHPHAQICPECSLNLGGLGVTCSVTPHSLSSNPWSLLLWLMFVFLFL